MIYELYKATRQLIESYEKTKQEDDPIELVTMFKDWVEIVEKIEKNRPQIKDKYEHELQAHKSFTSEQVDFICEQIGDWYLEWKEKMWVDGKPNGHWLGVAKEQLKTMICGD